MSKKSYQEKLKDPQWQKKRLEILERDSWQCQLCENKKETLHIHHTIYEKGFEPWEYPDYNLITLCESCHNFESKDAFEYIKDHINSLKNSGILLADIEKLLSVSFEFTDNRKLFEEFTYHYFLEKKGQNAKIKNDQT